MKIKWTEGTRTVKPLDFITLLATEDLKNGSNRDERKEDTHDGNKVRLFI